MTYITFMFANFKKAESKDAGSMILENDLSIVQDFPSYIDVIIR